MYIPPRDYMIHNGSLPIPNRNILIFCNLALLNQNKRFWRLGQIKLTIFLLDEPKLKIFLTVEWVEIHYVSSIIFSLFPPIFDSLDVNSA